MSARVIGPATPSARAGGRACRRGFLLGAAALGIGAVLPGASAGSNAAPELRWTGRALGAAASLRLRGETGRARMALAAAVDTLRRVERLFSLYDPASALSRLNRTGSLVMPPEFARLVAEVERAHAVTQGAFDPTVQPLFAAMLGAGGRLEASERRSLAGRIGWGDVRVRRGTIGLAPGMALTFNGIAQGFATDRVTETLRAHGFEDVVVDAGELRVGVGDATLGVPDEHGVVRPLRLRDVALATTHARAFTFPDGTGHILHPGAVRPGGVERVTVRARSATVADAMSTAIVAGAAPRELADRLVREGVIEDATLSI